MQVKLTYAKGYQTCDIADESILAVLTPNAISPAESRGVISVAQALANPIGSKRLREIVRPGETVAVITSDITRPLPSYLLLPPLLDELQSAGVSMHDITVVLRWVPTAGIPKLKSAGLWEMGFSNACGALITIPATAYGWESPNRVRRLMYSAPVARAQRRICLGNIEYHYFAGYSGGAKAIMPGVCKRDAIQSNHSMMVRPEAHAGRLEGNPVREDIEEVLSFCPVDCIVNVVLDEHKNIAHAVCGDPIAAHRERMRISGQSCTKFRFPNERILCWYRRRISQGHQPVPGAKGT